MVAFLHGGLLWLMFQDFTPTDETQEGETPGWLKEPSNPSSPTDSPRSSQSPAGTEHGSLCSYWFSARLAYFI